MAKEPWFKLWASDYLCDSDVQKLPLEAQGLLLRMWCACHIDGCIPSDPEELAVLIRCKLQSVLLSYPLCKQFFELRGGMLYSPRMEREKAKSAIARANAQSKHNKGSSAIGSANSSADGKANSPAQKARRPESQKKRETEEPKSAALPPWISEAAWNDFSEMRKKIRKPMTPRACQLIISELEKLREQGHDANAVLNQSVMNAWQSVYPIKDGENGKQRNSASQTAGAGQARADYNLSAASRAIQRELEISQEGGDHQRSNTASCGH